MTWPFGAQGPAGLLEYRWGSDTAPNTTSTSYLDHRVSVLSSADTYGKHLIQQAATLTKFRAKLFAALASSDLTLTLLLNGSPTAFVITITAGNTGGSYTGSLALSAGDLISVKVVQSAAEAGNVGLRVVAS